MASQNQLSRYGAISRTLPELSPSGRVFLVGDSDDTTYGVTALANDYPVDDKGIVRVYSTIQGAVNACDSRGDVVLVAPYHTENFTVVDTWDVQGVQIIGMGYGDARPSLTFNSATASVNLGANGIRVSNLMFLASADSIALALEMDTGFFGQRVDNCIFNVDAAATDEFRVMLQVGAKESIIEDNRFIAKDTTGSGRAISLLGGDPDHLIIRNNYFYGQFDTVGDTTNGAAVIATDSTNVADATLSGLVVENNKIVATDTATSQVIRLGAGGVTERGLFTNNQIMSYDTATADTAQLLFGGVGALNNFFISADSDDRQTVVSTSAAILHLDS